MAGSQLDMARALILLIPEVLTPDECMRWIARISAARPEPAPINAFGGTVINNRIRNNRRVMFDDPVEAEALYERVREAVPPDIHGMRLCGVNERLRCYEYQPGQRFAAHMDGAFVRDAMECSWYTFMIYLNEGFKGGETR